MILHTVNKSPFEKNSLESCLKHAVKGSAVLLIEDGVYGALKNTAVSETVKKALQDVAVYALAPDLDTRGVKDRILDGVRLVDYDGFVDMVAEHRAVQSWL